MGQQVAVIPYRIKMNESITTGSKKTEFDTGAHSRLARIEADNFWFCARNNLIIWALSRYFPNVKSFLEIGCGTGFVLSEIEKKMGYERVIGTDLYEEGLVYARQRLKKAEVFQVDIDKMALDEPVDLVGAFDVLEHIDKDQD